MSNKKVIIIGSVAAALGMYFLLRNNGKGTTVIKDDGSVDTKHGFDGTRAKNLIPDIYGRGIGRDVFKSLNGVSETRTGQSDMANMGGSDTVSICRACKESTKSNRYKVEIPKIL